MHTYISTVFDDISIGEVFKHLKNFYKCTVYFIRYFSKFHYITIRYDYCNDIGKM